MLEFIPKNSDFKNHELSNNAIPSHGKSHTLSKVHLGGLNDEANILSIFSYLSSVPDNKSWDLRKYYSLETCSAVV